MLVSTSPLGSSERWSYEERPPAQTSASDWTGTPRRSAAWSPAADQRYFQSGRVLTRALTATCLSARSTQPRAPDREDGAGQWAEEPRAPLPTGEQVAGWIREAKALRRAV